MYSNDTAKTVGIVVLTLIIIIQLEFLWHIGSRLLGQLQRIGPLLYWAFCGLFISAVYYAYRLNETKREAAQYRLHNYKRSDEFERQKRRITDEQVRKLTNSRSFKDWQTSRRVSHSAEVLDRTDQEYFQQLEKDVFEWQEPEAAN